MSLVGFINLIKMKLYTTSMLFFMALVLSAQNGSTNLIDSILSNQVDLSSISKN